MNQSEFKPRKYLGQWYELLTTPEFFNSPLNYNPMADYEQISPQLIKVTNSTINNGTPQSIQGLATYLGDYKFRVDFEPTNIPQQIPNYIIDKLWTDSKNNYYAAVITNPTKTYLSLLCRTPYPSLCNYNKFIKYIQQNFGNLQLFQVTHY